MALSESARRWVTFGGTWLLGILFMAAAFLKALDLPSFTQQIARYQLVPANLESPFGLALIAIEAVLGVACLASLYPRQALWGMIALLTFFLAATLFRWGLLQGANCNCFGPLVPGGPRAVVLHTVILIALAGGLITLMRKGGVPRALRGLRIIGGVLAMFLLMFVAHPFAANSTLPADALASDQIRIFLSATCPKCQQDAGKVKELASSTAIPPVRVFIGASYEQEIEDYFKKGQMQVDYTPLTFSQLSRETQHVPKVQIFRAGKMVREWEGNVPTLDEVRQALSVVTEAGSSSSHNAFEGAQSD